MVATLAALELWRDGESTAIVTPEGHDDIEVETSTRSLFIQVKSRRADAGEFAATDFRKDLQSVARNWSKRIEAGLPATTALVLERPVSDVPLHQWNSTAGREVPAHGPELAKELRAVSVVHAHSSASFAGSVSVVICPNVRSRAVEVVAHARDMPEALAEIVVAALCTRVGEASDANASPDIAGRTSVHVASIDDFVEQILATVDVKLLDEARSLGVCGPIDWGWSGELSDLGQGAHVGAAHVAAGALVARPDLTQRVIDVAEARHLAVIGGPSGSGKSSLAYSAVHQIRDSYRWQQVHSLEPIGVGGRDSIALLVARLESLRPSRYAPVGVLIDDAGRHDPKTAERLLRRLAEFANVITLVSVREEDRSAVPSLATLAAITPVLDDDFAKQLWQDYASRGLTSWAGWREPSERANGHLLEYVSLLTEGERLEVVVGAQVRERELDSARHLELKILRLASCANQYGVSIAAPAIQEALGADSIGFVAAGRRLINEHLVVEDSRGLLGPLHELRSAAISRAAHPFGQAETLKQLVELVPGIELARFLRRTLESGADSTMILDASVARLAHDRTLQTLTSVVSAFRADGVARRADEWKRILDACGVDAGNAITAFTLSRLTTTPGVEGLMRPEIAAAITQLRNVPTEPDMRLVWEALDEVLIESLFAAAAVGQDASDLLLQAITVLRGFDPRALESTADAIGARLSDWPLRAGADMMEALRRVAPALADRAVAAAGGEDVLLRRLVVETPWLASLDRAADGVDGKWIFVDEDVQPDPNGSVVEVCQLALALTPTATIARVNAVDTSGHLVKSGSSALVEKRIPRENLPHSLEVSENRAQARALSRMYGAGTLTSKLAAESRALAALTELLPEVVNAFLRDRPLHQLAVARVGQLAEMLAQMDAPEQQTHGEEAPGALGDYPDESAAVTIVRLLLEQLIPKLASASSSERRPLQAVGTLDILIPKVDAVIEFDRYRYLADPPDCQILRESLAHVRLVASAGAAADPGVWQAMRAAAGRHAGPQRIAAAAAVASERGPAALQREADRLQSALVRGGQAVSVVPSASDHAMMNWPAGDFAIIVDGEDLAAHLGTVAGIADEVRRARETADRRIWIVLRSSRGFVRASVVQVAHEGTLPLGKREPPTVFARSLAPTPLSLLYEKLIQLARRMSAMATLIAVRGGDLVPDEERRMLEESWEHFVKISGQFDELTSAHRESEYVSGVSAIIATISSAISRDLATAWDIANKGRSGWGAIRRLETLDLLDAEQAQVAGNDASIVYGAFVVIATIEDSFRDADERIARMHDGASATKKQKRMR